MLLVWRYALVYRTLERAPEGPQDRLEGQVGKKYVYFRFPSAMVRGCNTGQSFQIFQGRGRAYPLQPEV